METENNYTETDLGNVSPNPRGEYDPETEYEYLDTVSYQGGSYLCLADLGATINGMPPDPGHNTELWQMLTLPGDLTPEYVAMHDDVVNKAIQAEASRTAAETARNEAEAAQIDVAQMHADTLRSATEAGKSRDSAAGYAQSAERSRKAASESEQNINAQITGFDEKVSESIVQAQNDIAITRQQAIQAITSQQNTSVQKVKDQTADYISEKETEAKMAITDHMDSEIDRADTATKAAKDILDETIVQAETQNTALKKTISDAQNLSTEMGKTLQDARTAATNADAAADAANTAAKAAQDQADVAKKATDTLIAQTAHITFQVDSEDGGLNIIYTE